MMIRHCTSLSSAYRRRQYQGSVTVGAAAMCPKLLRVYLAMHTPSLPTPAQNPHHGGFGRGRPPERAIAHCRCREYDRGALRLQVCTLPSLHISVACPASLHCSVASPALTPLFGGHLVLCIQVASNEAFSNFLLEPTREYPCLQCFAHSRSSTKAFSLSRLPPAETPC